MINSKYAWLDKRGNIKIRFSYDPAMITKIKTLPNRAWNGGEKVWRCSLSIDAVHKLVEWGFKLCAELASFLTKTKEQLILKEIKVPGLKKELYPFQKLGVDFINQHNGRALIADEMGLGKTVQALAYLQLHKELKKCCIFSPNSLKLNWKREIKTWLGEDAIVISGSIEQRKKLYQKFKKSNIRFLIINYDLVARDKEYIDAL